MKLLCSWVIHSNEEDNLFTNFLQELYILYSFVLQFTRMCNCHDFKCHFKVADISSVLWTVTSHIAADEKSGLTYKHYVCYVHTGSLFYMPMFASYFKFACLCFVQSPHWFASTLFIAEFVTCNCCICSIRIRRAFVLCVY